MILHLDMDSFFASVEQLDNPGLRGKPVIVGGGDRGVVATASYEARAFGIHSAMPVSTARKLCPAGIFIHGRRRRYSELSAKIMECLRGFSPVVQQASIDEAYLDIAGMERLFNSLEELALSIKKSVAAVTGGLTCSIGIAPVKFLAKICSDINKPDGIYILYPEMVDSFLLPLAIEKLPGVGDSMSDSLRSFGITTVAQLRRLSRQFMLDRYGKWGQVLHERAFGIDPRPVRDNPPAKSESSEQTFERDISDRRELEKILLAQADKVGLSLRKNGFAGRTITLKIKFCDFKQITRSRTLATRVNGTDAIFAVALSIFAGVHLHQPVRLIGLCVSGFEYRSEQALLPGIAMAAPAAPVSSAVLPSKLTPHGGHQKNQFPRDDKSRLDMVVDALRQKFGKNIIQRATVFDLRQHEAARNFEGKKPC